MKYKKSKNAKKYEKNRIFFTIFEFFIH
ncbi:Hypothetical Protein MfeM64YM_0602 [Mycoplasmopsis fermentans M64]|uniref:Uncharacterized protein n=1 Tax=Mycoplasmopsis fermentans (strain M64) TaxID=943945 RepID=A0AB32XC04_MYCFM|nr:Hypothetical Protein MfeM64YM_0602 [Mycoplasmopsis fermentans M64]